MDGRAQALGVCVARDDPGQGKIDRRIFGNRSVELHEGEHEDGVAVHAIAGEEDIGDRCIRIACVRQKHLAETVPVLEVEGEQRHRVPARSESSRRHRVCRASVLVAEFVLKGDDGRHPFPGDVELECDCVWRIHALLREHHRADCHLALFARDSAECSIWEAAVLVVAADATSR